MGRPKHSSEKGGWENPHPPFSPLCFGLPILPFPPLTSSPHAINRIISFSHSVEVPDVGFQGSKDKTQVLSTKGCNILGTFQCQTRYTNALEVVLEKNQRHSKIPLYRLDQLSFSMQWMILNLPLSLQSKESRSLARVSPGATLWPP